MRRILNAIKRFFASPDWNVMPEVQKEAVRDMGR